MCLTVSLDACVSVYLVVCLACVRARTRTPGRTGSLIRPRAHAELGSQHN